MSSVCVGALHLLVILGKVVVLGLPRVVILIAIVEGQS
jgi:hypothetical protein